MDHTTRRLAGKVALVTGGGRGIGRGISTRLAADGAHVVVNYCERSDTAEATVDAIKAAGGSAECRQGDVSRAADVQRMFDTVFAAHGRLDILVNNAGRGGTIPFSDIDEAAWDRVIDTNLKGLFLCSHAAVAIMSDQRTGCIVNILSTSSMQGFMGLSHYDASKGGGLMLTRSLAVELGAYGIRVNAVGPGTIETDINRPGLSRDEFRKAEVRETPLGRLGTPEDVAGAVSYLVSDDAAWVTGQILYVDGGASVSGGSHYALRLGRAVDQ
jgi:3-oxoacyl-[acyl-carrier protein] reductase